MICRGCKKEIADDAIECPFCGRNQKMIYKGRNWTCSECDKINGPERSICWNCGQA